LSPASLIFFGPNMLSENVAGAITNNKYLKHVPHDEIFFLNI
jgi:hypothetical protein